jgi:hypothetical protein
MPVFGVCEDAYVKALEEDPEVHKKVASCRMVRLH